MIEILRGIANSYYDGLITEGEFQQKLIIELTKSNWNDLQANEVEPIKDLALLLLKGKGIPS